MTSPSPDPAAAAAFAAVLQGVLAPLSFLVRGDFEYLERIRDLETTLANGLARLGSAATHQAQKVILVQLMAHIPGVQAPRRERVTQLKLIHATLAAWQANGPPTVVGPPFLHAKSRPAPSASTGHQAVPSPQGAPKAPVAASTASVRREPAASPTQQRAAVGAVAKASATAATPAQRRPAPGAQAAAAYVPIPASEGAPALDAPLQFLKGVGPQAAAALAGRGLRTVEDLLRFLPRRYQGRSAYQAIGDLQADTVASVEGEVQAVNQRTARGRRTLEVVLTDGTGALHLLWFRTPGKAFTEQFARGRRFRASGAVKRYRTSLQIVHPETAAVHDSGMTEATALEDDLVPLYLEVDGLHPKTLRRIIEAALPAAAALPENLTPGIVAKHGLCGVADAIVGLHRPPARTPVDDLQDYATPWHRRLIYEELFFLQLGLLSRKAQQKAANGPSLGYTGPANGRMAALAKELLPFVLTSAQARVLEEIETDLGAPRVMQRLLQGDVGSGKTAVALMAAALCARAGLQTALMAPTELLAEQHIRTALKFLHPAGISCALLTGSTPAKERRRILAELADGRLKVIVGTHALIQSKVVFKALALAIVDEQHRFGVLQRARLTEFALAGLGVPPHMLVMTATPIPRTLALTVYGDLDLSVIDAMPPGRMPIVTRLYREGERAAVYTQVQAAVARGEQAYVVFPLVEESDKEGMAEIRAATTSAEELAAGPLYGLRLALLHGRLNADEKDAVMQAFLRRDVDVLVATTVIEVGIDVPNATVMVIEHAERFGLSQLHQLRGRVGRGAAASACLLLARKRPSEEAMRRLSVMERTQDGFIIAEEDLAIRGPGDFVGTRQSGLPVLSMANLARDSALLAAARQDATAILAKDHTLSRPEHASLRRMLQTVWHAQLKLAQVG